MVSIGVGRGDFDRTAITLASQIIARYSDSSQKEKVKIVIEDYSQKEIDFVIATSMGDNKLESFRI